VNNTRPEAIAAFCVGPQGGYKGATTFALWGKEADLEIPVLYR